MGILWSRWQFMQQGSAVANPLTIGKFFILQNRGESLRNFAGVLFFAMAGRLH
jgi:hypothetical protein